MASNSKEVQVKIVTKEDLTGVEAIENRLKEISKTPHLKLDVDKTELDSAKTEIEELDNEEIDVNINNITAMQAIDQISSGFDRLKQGASEIGQKLGEALSSSGEYQLNQAFLAKNIGADKAAQKAKEIDDILASLPGDDTILQGLMSSAVAKNANMTTDALKTMGGTAADYMAAMQKYGKTSLETQQDLNNYILAGNTGEIERSPVLASHVDKLKQAQTTEERTLALQEALKEEGFEGIAGLDIYVNNQQKFNDMLQRGQRHLGDMFMAGTDGAMKFLVSLDESTNGVVGLAFALGGMASPITDSLMGLGQMATGIKSVKELADFSGVTSKLSVLKQALFDVGSTAKEAGLRLIDLGRNALMAGLNALRAAGMWLIEKAQLLLSTAATYAMAAAQAFLNLVMSLNPIAIVIIAIVALIAVLVYLYTHVDSVRNAINGLGQSIIRTAQWIYTRFVIIGTIIKATLTRAWATIVNFGRNFVTSLINSARNAVLGFVNWIKQIPKVVMNEFNRTLQMVGSFIASLPQRVWDMGVAIINALKSALGIGSPGYMYYMLEGELKRLDKLPTDMSGDISGSISQIGSSMVHTFDDTSFSKGSSHIGGNQVFNIEIGSVDSRERIHEIVEIIRRELSWNNTTAGRTV